MLWLAAATLAIGLAHIIFGLRGSRVGDRPTCRRCGFDLVGSAAQERCPECGSELSRRRAIQIGTSRRLRFLLVIGAACLALTGVILWHEAARIGWNRLKPAWWLIREARAEPANHGVLLELHRRFIGGRLSPAYESAAVSTAMIVQSNPTIPWDREWGEIIDAGRKQMIVSDAQWVSYAKAGMGPVQSSKPNPFVLRRGRLYINPMVMVQRGRFGTAPLSLQWRLDRLVINGHEMKLPEGEARKHALLDVSTGLAWSNTFAIGELPVDPSALDARTNEAMIQSDWTIFICEPVGSGTMRTLAQWTRTLKEAWPSDVPESALPPHPSPGDLLKFEYEKQQPPPR